MHNWFKLHPKEQQPLSRVVWSTIKRKFRSRKSWTVEIQNFKEAGAGQELIDSFVDKDFNTRRSEVAESLFSVRYHTSLHFLNHFVLLEIIIKNLLNKDLPKNRWLKRMLELPSYFVRGPKKDRYPLRKDNHA